MRNGPDHHERTIWRLLQKALIPLEPAPAHKGMMILATMRSRRTWSTISPLILGRNVSYEKVKNAIYFGPDCSI
jgi:hypothetical protein